MALRLCQLRKCYETQAQSHSPTCLRVTTGNCNDTSQDCVKLGQNRQVPTYEGNVGEKQQDKARMTKPR